MVEFESDSKYQLIKQICDTLSHAKSCVHHTDSEEPFIDWYILLQVEDNASVDLIRKKYYKYALLLHPDKNKHPKAEFAFKLISEAYACLSDEAKRSDFDAKRLNNLCRKCFKTPQSSRSTKVSSSSSSSSSSDKSRSKKISAKLKELRARFKEESRVIEKCLKANANVDVFDKEIPVFDPNDYGNQEYPHFRVWRCNDDYKKSTWSSPIFECKPNRSSFKLKS